MSSPKCFDLGKMKTSPAVRSDLYWDFMHKDDSAALLQVTTERTISLTASKTSVPPEFGKPAFFFFFLITVSVPSAASLRAERISVYSLEGILME